MDRRSFLTHLTGVTGLAGAVGLSGCRGLADRGPGDGPNTSTRTGTTARPSTGTGVNAVPLARQGYPPDICEQDTVDVGIYAVVDPVFAPDWSGIDVDQQYAADVSGGETTGDDNLASDAVVIGVGHGDSGRAYPLSVLWQHEIVNDTVPADFVGRGGTTTTITTTTTTTTATTSTTGRAVSRERPLLVTYCSICRSGMVAGREVAGEPARFEVSGQLWQAPQLQSRASVAQGRTFGATLGNASGDVRVRHSGNLVMVDDVTGSYWSQILARAICGPRTGDSLDIVPSTLSTWGAWRETHPETDVLLPPPHSGLAER